MAADGVDAAIERCAKVVPEQLTTMFSTCASDSHRLSEYVLEHILVHEAAAQQLQVRAYSTNMHHAAAQELQVKQAAATCLQASCTSCCKPDDAAAAGPAGQHSLHAYQPSVQHSWGAICCLLFLYVYVACIPAQVKPQGAL
jgi:1,6-anhydro-N-acetylmuramate kinase